MIVYEGKLYGFGLILRLHGSAAARALLPASLSTLYFFLLYYYYIVGKEGYTNINENAFFRVGAHPYVFSALVGFFGFLLTFRANYSYNRYWEGTGCIFQMLSQWGDVGNTAAAFHMQSTYYDKVMPPSFGSFPEIQSVVQQRVRQLRPTFSDVEQLLNAHHHNRHPPPQQQNYNEKRLAQLARQKAYQEALDKKSRTVDLRTEKVLKKSDAAGEGEMKHEGVAIDVEETSSPNSSSNHDNNNNNTPASTPWHTEFDAPPSSRSDTRENASATPSLFLQELCHRLSLLSAVAMATLRNTDQNADLALVGYTPGEMIPPMDPDALSRERRREYHEQNRVWTFIKYLLGLTRSKRHRTLYSYARPFRVLGGISDAETVRLQAARGEHAKVMLCEFWLQEFLIREHLHGSMGTVAPPIISRLFQEVNNGALYYSQARKITKIPFPFPHAQLTAMFVFVLAVIIPWLYLSFSNFLWFGAMMNFCTVLCFVGMHEVARELENPFQNAPNDIPLMTLQAEFNEALVTLQTGYHPDSYWSVVE